MKTRLCVVAGALVLAGALVAAGCGSDDQQAAAPTTVAPSSVSRPVAPAPEPAPVTAPPAPPAPSEAPIATRLVMVEADGSRVRITLRVGDLYKVGTEPAIPGLAAHRCEVDPLRDAVIPVELTLENLTDGFPIEAEFSLLPQKGPVSVEFVERDGEGRCWLSPATAQQYARQTTLAPDDSVAYPGYLIVREYFTPATPRGNRTLLCGIELSAARFANLNDVSPVGADQVPLRPGQACA